MEGAVEIRALSRTGEHPNSKGVCKVKA